VGVTGWGVRLNFREAYRYFKNFLDEVIFIKYEVP